MRKIRYYKLCVDGTNSFFTYCDENDEYNIGDRVAVSFRGREQGALIAEPDKSSEFEFKVLPIKRKLTGEVSLNETYMKMLLWVRNYYMCKFEQVLKAAIPSDLKVKYEEVYKLTDNGRNDFLNPIINYFLEREQVTKPVLRKHFSKEFINNAVEKNILIINTNKKICYNFKSELFFSEDDLKGISNDFTEENLRELKNYFTRKSEMIKTSLENKFAKKEIERLIKEEKLLFIKRVKEKEEKKILSQEKEKISVNAVLNSEQQKVRDKILNSQKKYFLIKGITGSGKTEIYINLIREALLRGKGSIFLVPEISLTPQMVERFKKEFEDGVAILHSRLSNKERGEEWLKLYSGEKKVVLGVRSAVFAPVKELEYIIIDEEHESSYKQDTTPIYNAKFVALKRSQLEGCKVIFGSATPSIESYYFGKTGMFELLTLESRYNNAVLPDVKVVDMKDEEDSFFSKELLKNIRETLLKKEQVILLLNRKGYSTMVQCKECGHIEECEHCSIKMSYYHSRKTLKCNYCGTEKRFNGKCSKCGSSELDFGGKGVEQVEHKLKEYFDVPIVRMDADNAREKNFYKETYYKFLNKEYDIMIGTQLIAKGLHFPNVTLVGVINADMILSFPDFRAGEKTYQLITQAAGRAGRGDKKGKVIIQSYQPESYVMEKIMKNDYEGFYNSEIEMRKILGYPPFSKIINIGISSSKEEKLEKIAKRLFNAVKRDYVEIYGPNKSLVYKVKDRYRENIFIKGSKKNIDYYKKELEKILTEFDDEGCRIVVDIDPVNLI
ncbi:replication restart helicase PriA [Fusobacterium perfoetens]|uniref:replication restart helicase PriA n=1 Tax=Fusobacterium perfoetens TaxID=852 RepID=UPI003AF32A65